MRTVVAQAFHTYRSHSMRSNSVRSALGVITHLTDLRDTEASFIAAKDLHKVAASDHKRLPSLKS